MFSTYEKPTDRRKSIKPLSCRHHISYASPNISELRAMADFLKPNHNISKTDDLIEVIEISKIVLNSVDLLLVTRGAGGVVTIRDSNRSSHFTQGNYKELEVRLYSTEALDVVENVSGAGDCFSSGFICGVLLGLEECQSISYGFSAAKEALVSKKTVPSKFNMPNNIKATEYKTFKL